MRFGSIRWLLVGSVVGCAAGGCSIESPDFAGKACTAVTDCPLPFTCVSVRPGEGRTCEVVDEPGVVEPAPGGPVPTWCADIQPVMQASCVSGCHVPSGVGPAGFRLDVYDSDGGVLGAQEMAARILERTVIERSMPPAGVPFTEQQRDLVGRWVTGGAPRCEDGAPGDAGTPDAGTFDAGTPDAGRPDAGTPDAGRPDAGAPDAGTPDAGRPDAGAPDAGTPDAGRPDAGAPDAGAPDAGTPDAGTPDAGRPDAGAPDAGRADGGP